LTRKARIPRNRALQSIFDEVGYALPHPLWPADAVRPHETTLWRWLDRSVELGLAERVGKGTKTEPYRYGVGR
jgi:hypothetical protein